jgi:hypothetical protein
MDQVEKYRAAIKKLICEYAQFKPSLGEVNVETVFDEDRDHYELIYEGWEGVKRIHGSVIHVDLRQGKVWIQFDGTEDGIAEELVEAGIPRDQIVLGFHSPEKRKHTQFAVA